ncbi:hypothetical protein RintRC_3093 [Richelia intracellularis]|nr:hypothetical protein RintRC_3093 [Richelia intracellularis]
MFSEQSEQKVASRRKSNLKPPKPGVMGNESNSINNSGGN